MDILDIMDLLGVGHPLLNNTESSPLLDDSFNMEPDNLSQPVARTPESGVVTSNEVPVSQNFVERNLELKLPVLSSSSSDSEPEDPTITAAGSSAGMEGERVASPPPNCAICLGRCKNKCFTDSCMHQFCFKCLCEWSKVKPECPLCKQTFKSIIHNVKSIHQFEEYHVQPPTVQIGHADSQSIFDVFYTGHNRIQAWNAWNGSTVRPYYLGSSPFSTASNGGSIPAASGSSGNRSTASSANGSGVRNQYVYRGELLDLYRQEYPGAIANSATLSQLWRRYVYDRKLYALPVADITGRFRESNARFYRDNQSQIHRLMPWINRDIVCLLRQTQHDVTTVLESINSALTVMNILSPAFRRRLHPFLGNKTAHFIHELNNFARSPYDMIGYDRAVQYSPQTNNEEIVIEFSSSDESTDSDNIDVAGEIIPASRSTNSSSTNGGIFENDDVGSHHRVFNSYLNPFTAINLTIHNRLTSASASGADNRGAGISVGNGLGDIQDDVSLVIDLRGESDNNETNSTAQATNNSSNYLNGQNAGTSESDIINTGLQPSVSENIELTSGSSDECEFILERKPPHLRTPEMVSLDSASDSDVVFVEESKALNKTSFSSSEEEIDVETNDQKHPRRHNKIAALVQAKKRHQSANLVKSEQQDSNSSIYNMGASTSAALRLSLQKRAEKSQGSQHSTSSKRPIRNKYSLRKNDNYQIRTERKSNRRRGKRLDSESSHSITSTSSTTISSISSITTSSSTTSSNSSDEEYVLDSQRKKAFSAGARELNSRKRGSKTRKSNKRKASKSNSSRTAKHDTRKRKVVYSSEDDDEADDDNGLRRKHFALSWVINERWKREVEKNSHKTAIEKHKQEKARSSHKSNERKRPHKTSTHQSGNRNKNKLQKFDNCSQEENEIQNLIRNHNSEGTSSDESDNINLIQLKTKLTGQDYHKNTNMEQNNTNEASDETTTNIHTETTTTTSGNINENYNNITATTSSTADVFATATNASTSNYRTIPPDVAANVEEASCSRSNNVNSRATEANEDDTSNCHLESITTQHHGLFNFSDDSSNFNNQNNNQHNNIDSNNHESADQNGTPQNIPYSASSPIYSNHENHLQLQNDNAGQASDYHVVVADNDYCDDDEIRSNVATTMNLNESNVFADATSMSTTTTDTILHEAAEQISSAAVNFYNPRQTFNTADFADENSTNSSSSDSSVSSSTTSQSSSSSSSSTN